MKRVKTLPSPSGKVANRAVCRDDLTEGDNKLLLFADLRLLSPIVGYRRHFPRRRKRCPSFFNVFRLNGGIYPEEGSIVYRFYNVFRFNGEIYVQRGKQG